MPWLKFFFTLLLMLILPSAYLSAQNPKFKFTQITTENGLANSNVNDIIQDKKGFIWIATNNGLQRFDGLRFSTFRFHLNDSRSLPSDIVGKLLEDSKGNLWIGCNNGIGRISNLRQAPQRIPVELHNDGSIEPRQLFQDSKNNIWLITRSYGAFLFNEKSNTFIEGRKKLPFNNWTTFSMEEERTTGNYWIGTDSGLAYIDVKQHQLYNYNYNPLKIPILSNPKFYHNVITGLKLDQAGKLWLNIFISDYPRSTQISYESYYYTLATGTLTAFKAPNFGNYQYALDGEKKLWLLGEDIFSIRTDSQFVKIPVDKSDADGLRSDNVSCLIEDKDHNRWIGTSEGMFVFNPEANKMGRNTGFDDKKNRLSVTPMQFLELPGNKVWMATWGEGIMEYDLNFNPIRKLSFGTEAGAGNYHMVWSMVKAKDNRVWIGCQSGRLMIYDLKTDSYVKLAPPEFDLRTIRTSAEDKKGNIWFGTQHGLIVKYDINSKKFIRYAEHSYPHQEVYGNINGLMVDDKNYLWVCTTADGVLKIDTETGKILETFKHNEDDPTSLASNTVNNIIAYNDSIYVIASVMGLNFLNIKTKKFTHITTQEGLPSNMVLSIRKDLSNNIWVGQNGFLAKVAMPSKSILVMGRKDGIFTENFQPSTMELLSDGKIVGGTTDDFVYFQPKSFQSSAPPPIVYITSFKVFDQDINIDSVLARRRRITLPFNQNFIRIEYSPLGFLNDNLTYYYKLEGLDKDWIRGSGDLSANYANLAAGSYTFLVRSQNSDGASSSKITSLLITIRPPFWETWWFLFMLAIAAAGALYFVHRLRVNRLIAMEAVRSRIARDLHDDMGSTLSTINILSEMAKMKIENDTDVTKSYISKISDNSSRMMEAMDDIVWSINPMNDNMQKITARMREYATNLLEAKEIEYTFQVDEAVKMVKLDMEARRDFFLIFKEAINNLAKYSQCKHAHIKIEVYEYTLCMKIQDDGIGFVLKEADSGNGLTNMTKRAQTLNGKFNIKSEPGVGTKIFLEVNFA